MSARTKFKNVKISVTTEDIQSGRAADCSKCPIALAFLRQLDVSMVDVSSSFIFVSKRIKWTEADYDSELSDFDLEEGQYTVEAPAKADAFIEGFDQMSDFSDMSQFITAQDRKQIMAFARSKIKPFSFTISVPVTIIRSPVLNESKAS